MDCVAFMAIDGLCCVWPLMAVFMAIDGLCCVYGYWWIVLCMAIDGLCLWLLMVVCMAIDGGVYGY